MTPNDFNLNESLSEAILKTKQTEKRRRKAICQALIQLKHLYEDELDPALYEDTTAGEFAEFIDAWTPATRAEDLVSDYVPFEQPTLEDLTTLANDCFCQAGLAIERSRNPNSAVSPMCPFCREDLRLIALTSVLTDGRAAGYEWCHALGHGKEDLLEMFYTWIYEAIYARSTEN